MASRLLFGTVRGCNELLAASMACSELVRFGLACCKLPSAALKCSERLLPSLYCQLWITYKQSLWKHTYSQWNLTVSVLLRTALSYYRLLWIGLVWSLLLWAARLKHNLKNLAKRAIHSKMLRQSSNSVWEGDTSMSPRCSETTTFFEKLHMYLAFSLVLRHLKPRKKVCQIADTREIV